MHLQLRLALATFFLKIPTIFLKTPKKKEVKCGLVEKYPDSLYCDNSDCGVVEGSNHEA